MNKYNNISIWENRRRLEKLEKFRGHIDTYFNYSKSTFLTSGSMQPRKESEEALISRCHINMMVHEIHKMIVSTRVITVFKWTPPPSAGGNTQNVDIISNLFAIDMFQIPPNRVTDILDQAIGVYQTNEKQSFIRTCNPFWWIGLCLRWFSRTPSWFIDSAGYNTSKMEGNFFGALNKISFLNNSSFSFISCHS